LVAVALLAPSHALAQVNATSEAKDNFERGYTLFQRGDFATAATLFERAYTLRPNYSVLYNLAQAYASSGRLAAAVDAFERYLREGGAEIAEDRRKSVESAVRYYSSRIGTLDLAVTPPGADVSVDGRHVGKAPLSAGLRVNAGPHVVTAKLPQHELGIRAVDVAGGAATRVELQLAREKLADFHVECPVPGVTLSVDGAVLPASPQRVLRLSPAQHHFEFRRAGYLSHGVTLGSESGNAVRVRCKLQLDPAAPDHAALRIRHPPGTSVRLDGAPFRSGRVPHGKHAITVAGRGYAPLHTELTLAPRERRVLELVPERSRSERERSAQHAESVRHTVAYALGGAGLAAGTVAAVLYVSNNGAHTDWQRDNRDFVERFNRDPRSVNATELDALIERENSIRDRDTLAVGLSVLGGAALVGAAVLRLWPSASPPPMMLSRSASDVSLGMRF
jgi:hypothetical protein